MTDSLAATTGTSDHITATKIIHPRTRLWFRIAWGVLAIFDIVLLLYLLATSLQTTMFMASWGFGAVVIEREALNLTLYLLIGLLHFGVCFGIASVLIWRRGDERASAIFSLVFLAFALFNFPSAPESFPTLLRILYTITGFIGFFSILYLFPDGRFVPPAVQYPFFLLNGVTLLLSVMQTPLAVILLNISFAIGVGSLVYRYYRAPKSTVQHQQLKWLVLTFILIVVSGLSAPVILTFVPESFNLTFAQVYVQLIFLLIPITISLAILRLGLWTMDWAINRSLVYGGVTVVVVVAFLAFTLGGQVIARQVIGERLAEIRLVVTTVVSLLLFNPARNRLQKLVDSRIFGLRYDLNQVAAAQKKPEIKNPGAYTGRVFGKYELLGLLGRGGMGEVYKGFGEGQTVAIKVLPESLADQEEFRKRFQLEARALHQLQHPNIVKLYDSGVSDGVYYLAMEQIEGEELADCIKKGQISDFDDIREWISQVAAALDYAHAQGLVHRDLKPSNIMLRLARNGETREAILMDFGVARLDDGSTRLTGTGTIGTIDYMAPEQVLAAREVDHRADIYALGLILYEMLTGERPFKGGPAQVMFAHLQQPPGDPRDLREDVPRNMAKAALKALEKKPEDRFQSAGELAAALV